MATTEIKYTEVFASGFTESPDGSSIVFRVNTNQCPLTRQNAKLGFCKECQGGKNGVRVSVFPITVACGLTNVEFAEAQEKFFENRHIEPQPNPDVRKITRVDVFKTLTPGLKGLEEPADYDYYDENGNPVYK